MLLLLHRSGVVVANVEPLSLRHDGVQVEEEKGWRGRRGLEKEQDAEAEAEAEAEAQTPLILKYRSLCPRLHLITSQNHQSISYIPTTASIIMPTL